MSLRHLSGVVLAGLFGGTAAARADITLLLEEPYGEFGGMNPTGHAAVYFSRICATSPVALRRCREGRAWGACSADTIGRGIRLDRHPVIPYLYAVDRAPNKFRGS